MKIRVSPVSSELVQSVRNVAQRTDRPVTALFLQALIQLPRIANEEGLVDASILNPFLEELAKEIPAKVEWSVADVVMKSPRALKFQQIGDDESRRVMKRFHYLHSARIDGRAYGLRTECGRLVALCVSSPLDIDRLHNLLKTKRAASKRARVLSRVFVFEGAPVNSISYLLSRAAQSERRLGASDWMTYVNPNMGFTGVSYLASGWYLLGDEPGTTYRYVDNRYITDRELANRFGSRDDESYAQLLGNRFAKSVMPLAPLLVFARHFVSVSKIKESPEHRELFEGA
ncbi:MAG TPA: hypothetical protein VJP89_08930 [Pyrinomonadaceae bacterium]|nr:hypothetical protein [Pyrinomonadaceae bacterium]